MTTSTPANGSTYALGETIEYKITVKNDGNLTITDVEVKDELTGETWTIASLAPGAEEVFTTSYVVKEADILAGKVVNVATATGTSPDPDQPDVPVVPGEDPEPTEEQNPSLTVEKKVTSTPADEKYVLDEEVTYQVKVTNTGNVTVKNITIEDSLVTLTGENAAAFDLEPGASKTITYTYVVTVDDVVAGSILNTATATGKDPGDKNVIGEDNVTVETKKKGGNDVDPEPDPDDPGEEMDVDGKSITVVYDGKAHSLTAKATVAGSTVWYSTDGGATWTTTPPSRTAVGKTTFSIKATHPAYEDVVKDGYSLTVLPKDLIITIADASKMQGEADPEFTYTVKGLVEGETIPAGLIKLFRDAGEAPGTYTIHGSIGKKSMSRAKLFMHMMRDGLIRSEQSTFDASNYNITFVEGTLEILAKPAGKFSFLWVSDTLLKGEGAHDDAFKTITDYAKKSVKFNAVISTGNVVDAFDNEAAWTSAKNNLNGLRIPFFGVAGTKDVNGDEMNYDAYLAADLNSKTSAFEDGSVWYRRFGDKKLLLVGIGYQKIAETDEEKEREEKWLSFVNNAIASCSNDHVVLIVNDYMDATGELTAFGKLIEEKIVKGNENVCMILCGNADGAFHKEMTYGERRVAVAMYNYAADEENGLGIVRIVTIDPEENTVKFSTIDAATGKAFTYDETKPEADLFKYEDLF